MTADNVSVRGLTQRQTYAAGDQTARLTIAGKDFSYDYGVIERTDKVAVPYGYIVEYLGEGGTFAARHTRFTAPYDKDTAFADSPALIDRKAGSVDLDECIFETNGYAFFDVHVTKGVIKDSLFRGTGGDPLYAAVNSMALDGLTLSGNTFTDTVSTMLILGGKFDILSNTFTAPAKADTLYIGIYSNSGAVAIRDNAFTLSDEKGKHYGIRLNQPFGLPAPSSRSLSPFPATCLPGRGITLTQRQSRMASGGRFDGGRKRVGRQCGRQRGGRMTV